MWPRLTAGSNLLSRKLLVVFARWIDTADSIIIVLVPVDKTMVHRQTAYRCIPQTNIFEAREMDLKGSHVAQNTLGAGNTGLRHASLLNFSLSAKLPVTSTGSFCVKPANMTFSGSPMTLKHSMYLMVSTFAFKHLNHRMTIQCSYCRAWHFSFFLFPKLQKLIISMSF